MQAMPPLAITARTLTTACGHGLAAHTAALRERRSGLHRNDFSEAPLETWIGRVEHVEQVQLPKQLQGWDCRNNRLAWMGLHGDELHLHLQGLMARYGAERIAIVIGTSTSSIGASEEAYTRLENERFPADLDRPIVHTVHSLGSFLAIATGLTGPCVTVATACSSSAKVFAQAARMIHAGLVDAALVGGVDSLCGSILFGFNSLGLISPEPCRPFDVARRGLSLGEAAGFAILEREGAGPLLLGYGESSDAHHMSSPHPEGLGAKLSMQAALRRAGLEPTSVDYLNLHGTATTKNDEIEAAAVSQVFGDSLKASSTKAWTGHTLGAAGIVESLFALSAIDSGLMPGTMNCDAPDPACGPQLLRENLEGRVRVVMNNSFGFGGNNCSLVFGAEGVR